MKVLVYDQFWSTMGGGEKLAGAFAQVLSEAGHDVSLLAHEPVDLEVLSERLALDIEGIPVEVVSLDTDAVTAASAEVDLFVNASFGSAARNAAPIGLYYVYFPTMPELARSSLRRRASTAGLRLLGAAEPRVEALSGLHSPDVLRRHAVRWTTGHARFAVAADRGAPTPVTVSFARNLHPAVGPVEVEIVVDGNPAGSAVVTPVAGRTDLRRIISVTVTVPPRADGSPAELAVRSRTHVPRDLGVGDDHRVLGVPIAGIEAGAEAGRRVAGRLPGLFERPPGLGFLDTYHEVLSLSEYTRGWVRRLWSRDTPLLFPPVSTYEPGTKKPMILTVGRFFPRGSGHSKKQLEMVEAFGRLHRAGQAPGWALHLVGGCAPEHRHYLDEVRAAAEGLPVELHVGATGEELRALYGEASIYWHATGLGEDADIHPDRFEHFGITTVEAMSAGAVPVVIGRAGQREVVRAGVDGEWFDDLDGLVKATASIIADDERRARLAASARERARDFDMTAFGKRVLDIVADVTPSP